MAAAAALTLGDLTRASAKSERGRTELASKAAFSKKTQATIAVPVDPVRTARAARKEGYEQTKKELDEWSPFVRDEARSEYLRFGDRRRIKQAPPPPPKEDDAAAEEDDDVGDRAKTRSVLFHAEQKNKYHKNKSKAHEKTRRKRKKERARADKEAAAAEDPELKKRLDEEAALKRLKERTSLRHASSSAWAKAVKKRGRGALDANADARREARALHQQLSEKATKEDDDEDEEEEEEEEEQSSSPVLAADRKKAKVESMAFVRRAMEESKRAQARAEKEVQALDDELREAAAAKDDDAEDKEEEEEQVPFAQEALEPGSLRVKRTSEDAWMRAIELSKDKAPRKREEEAAATEKTKEPKTKKRARDMSQAELVSMAFDEGEALEFAREKEETEAAPAPSVDDGRMAGWGSWTGEGVPQPKRKKPPPKPKAPTLPPGHPGKSPHVIINPKSIKKQAHLKVNHLPYPFTSKAQYAQYMAQPLGKEWNADAAVSILTRPDVVARPGVPVAPIRKVARPHA